MGTDSRIYKIRFSLPIDIGLMVFSSAQITDRLDKLGLRLMSQGKV